jgi:hypothetical protein
MVSKIYVVSSVMGRTVRVKLEDLEIHVRVCDNDVELFFKGEEVGCHAFEVVFAAAEEHHLIRLFLVWLLVLLFYVVLGWSERTVYPVNQTPLYASPISSMPVFGNDFSVVT